MQRTIADLRLTYPTAAGEEIRVTGEEPPWTIQRPRSRAARREVGCPRCVCGAAPEKLSRTALPGGRERHGREALTSTQHRRDVLAPTVELTASYSAGVVAAH